MAISTLTIDIVAKLASLEKDLGKAARLSEQAAGRINSAFKTTGAVIGGALAGIGIASVVQGFRNVVDQLDALNDAADATGASIENLSALEDIGKRTGASFESVTSILVKFNGVLKDVDGKNGASQALKAIGLEAEALKRLDPAEALRQVAVALQGFADDGNKARIVQELFGKSVREAAPFLKDLAEAGKLNATVTTEQAQEAEKFNKQMFQLDANIGKVGRSITSTLVPALNKLFEKLSKGSVPGALGFDKKFFDTAALGRLASDVNTLNSLKGSFEDGLRADPSNREYARRLAEVSDQLDVAKKKFKEAKSVFDKVEFENKMEGLMAPYVPREPQLKSIDVPQAGSAAKAAEPKAATRDDSAERYIEQLNNQIRAMQQLTTLQEVEARLQGDLAGKVAPAQNAKLRSLAEEIDKKEALADVDKYLTELINEKADAEARATDEAMRYYEASLTPAEQLADRIKRINELYEQGAFGDDASSKKDRAIKTANDEFTAQDEKLRALNDTAKEFSDIMLNAVMNGQDLGKALEQIAMKAFIFDPLSDALSGLFKGAMGGGGGAGGILGALFGGFFADGGSPPVGKVSVVGEDGPEWFVPKSAGTIIPNKALSSMGGQAVNITQHITIGEGVSANGVMSAMQASKEMAKAEMMQILRGRGVPV